MFEGCKLDHFSSKSRWIKEGTSQDWWTKSSAWKKSLVLPKIFLSVVFEPRVDCFRSYWFTDHMFILYEEKAKFLYTLFSKEDWIKPWGRCVFYNCDHFSCLHPFALFFIFHILCFFMGGKTAKNCLHKCDIEN